LGSLNFDFGGKNAIISYAPVALFSLQITLLVVAIPSVRFLKKNGG